MENIDTAQTVFILDSYDKYHDRDKIRKVFYMNNRWWCIKEIILSWGIPQLDSIEETYYNDYHFFNTFEEAEEAVRKLKKWEGVPF